MRDVIVIVRGGYDLYDILCSYLEYIGLVLYTVVVIFHVVVH